MPADEHVDVTVVLRRRAALPRALVEGRGVVARADLAERFGADPADVALTRRVLGAAGLTVGDADAGARRMAVSGPAAAVGAVFGAELTAVRSKDARGRAVRHRARQGGLRVPVELDGVVLAVLGADDRPHGAPLLRAHAGAPGSAGLVAYPPPRLAGIYDFPPGTDGSGRVAAMVEFGGGYDRADLDTYFAGLGIAPPSVTPVEVAGGRNAPGADTNADGEVQLDIQVLGSLAPGARMVVYFAPATDRGYVEALTAAVHAEPTPTVLSISWGAPENRWSAQSRAAIEEVLADAAALGITVCAAAGDTGSSDGEGDGALHLDYPGSSPHALSVGGTSLRADAAPAAETVWNARPAGGATGGGLSAYFDLPAWQRTAGVPEGGKRGVPDVAAVADPATGYAVRVSGTPTTLGGTSAAAPLWAALACRLSEALDAPLGLLAPTLYRSAAPARTAAGLKDITQGDNGAFHAGPGWDPCTGLGTPLGAALLAALREAARDGA